jgi:hypothetical protein
MKKGPLLLVFAVSLLLLAGCPGKGDHVIPSEEGASISVDTWVADVEGPNETLEEDAEEEDWAALALANNDTSYCLKLPANERDDCILPLSNDSLSNCLQLTAYENKILCLTHLAYATDNITICDLMGPDERQPCLEDLSPPCTFVLDADEKARCFAFAYQNYTLCRDDECLLDYAFEFSEEEACRLIESEPRMNGCLSATKHRDMCKDLEGSNKDLCYYIYALGDGSPRMCYYINGKYETEMALQCFTHFAIEDLNPSLCSAVLVTNRWACYTDYAIETGDKGGCYAIDTRAEASREDCFEQYAYAYDDLLSCNEIETPYVRQICYSALIFDPEEITLAECNGITLPEWKDKCFQELARQEDSQTYCNYIVSQTVKDNCILMLH